MKVEKFDYNDILELNSTTYVVSDANNNAVVIDPSMDNDKLINYIEKNKLNVKGILLTHGHFDHIRGVDRLVNKYKVPLYIHFDEVEYLKNPRLNCSYMEGDSFVVESNPISVIDNEELNLLEDEVIKVIHTPFHTRGSVCYYFINNKLLFSGDTLFKMSVGRDDLPGAMPEKTQQSLSKIKKLPKETKIYPGHGPNTVLESELALNNFLCF